LVRYLCQKDERREPGDETMGFDAKGKCEGCGKSERYHDDACDPDDVRRHAANVKRRARARVSRAITKDVLDSCGVHRVRGALGGTYYE
jgi:hypothetical protein